MAATGSSIIGPGALCCSLRHDLQNLPDLVPAQAAAAPVHPLRAATPHAFHALACAAGPAAPSTSTPSKLHVVDTHVVDFINRLI